MWPQPEILPGDQRSQPPLACSYSAISVIYCQLDRNDRLDLSPGSEQLDWWHGFCLVRSGTAPYQRNLDMKRLDTETAEGCPLSILQACRPVSESNGVSPLAVLPCTVGLVFYASTDLAEDTGGAEALRGGYGGEGQLGLLLRAGTGSERRKGLARQLEACPVRIAADVLYWPGKPTKGTHAILEQRMKDADCIACSAQRRVEVEGTLIGLTVHYFLRVAEPSEVRCVLLTTDGLSVSSHPSCQWSTTEDVADVSAVSSWSCLVGRVCVPRLACTAVKPQTAI